jgi:hypothetical protein
MGLFGLAALSDALVVFAMLASAGGSVTTGLGRLTAGRASFAGGLAIASFALTGALIGLSMYLVFTPVGAPEVIGVQLRYYVPVFILFLALPSVILAELQDAPAGGPASTRAQIGAGVVAGALALALVSQTLYRVLERYY